MNRKNTFLVFLFSLFVHYGAMSQVVFDTTVQQVIGATGGSAITPWGSIDFTVGEVIVQTDSAPPSSPFPPFKWLTQGFQQPGKNALSVAAISINSPCIGANKGSVNLLVRSSLGTLQYSFGDTSDFSSKHLYEDLAPGTYLYAVKDNRFYISGSVTITENQKDCDSLLGFYTGITPNEDGVNDKWIIDSITNYKTNKVSIFNRWGDLVWSEKNYDNESVVWKGENQQGQKLPDATYFYIVEVGTNVRKGWVELSH